MSGNIRYTQDEESALQALEKEDYQAAFILNATKAEEILAIVSTRRKDAAEIDLFLSQAALRFDRQQDRCGRADRNCGDIIRNQDQFPFFKLEILSPRPPLRPLKSGPFQFIISY